MRALRTVSVGLVAGLLLAFVAACADAPADMGETVAAVLVSALFIGLVLVVARGR